MGAVQPSRSIVSGATIARYAPVDVDLSSRMTHSCTTTIARLNSDLATYESKSKFYYDLREID